MLRAALLSASLLLAFSARALSEESTCHLYEYGSAPLTMSQWDLPTTKVKVNGADLTFLVSSTSGTSVISRRDVTKLKIRERSGPDGVHLYFHGADLTHVARPNSLSIGGARINNLVMYIALADQMPEGIDGVLALDSIQSVDVDLDYGSGKLNLFSSKHCKGGEVVYWTKAPAAAWPFRRIGGGYYGIIETMPTFGRVSAQLDGQDLNAVLATMSPVSRLDLSAARRLFGRKKINAQMKQIAGPKSPWPGPRLATPNFYSYPFKSLSLAGVGIANPNIALQDLGSGDETLVIGNSILSKLHLYIAYRQKMVYVTGANAH